eukprot:3630784-Rhodomonas_salina.1
MAGASSPGSENSSAMPAALSDLLAAVTARPVAAALPLAQAQALAGTRAADRGAGAPDSG